MKNFVTLHSKYLIKNEESINNHVDFGTYVKFLQLLQHTAEIDWLWL